MSMEMMQEVPKEDWDEVPRFDFLAPVLKDVVKVVECHANEDDDSTYLFVVWLRPDADVRAASLKMWEVGDNNNSERVSGSWRVETFGDMIVVYDEVC
jgi:hypothetical protein